MMIKSKATLRALVSQGGLLVQFISLLYRMNHFHSNQLWGGDDVTSYRVTAVVLECVISTGDNITGNA